MGIVRPPVPLLFRQVFNREYDEGYHTGAVMAEEKRGPVEVVRSLAVLVLCAACVMILVPGLRAEGSDNTWFGTGDFHRRRPRKDVPGCHPLTKFFPSGLPIAIPACVHN